MTPRTEREYRLGVENAKLSKRIHQQRQIIRDLGVVAGPALSEMQEHVRQLRLNQSALSNRNAKLATENRALRLYIAEQKIAPLSFRGLLRQWIAGRQL